MKKINILFVIDQLNATYGTEKHLLSLVKYLDKNKFNCTVVSFDLNPSIANQFIKEGVEIYHFPLNRIYSLDSLIKGIRLSKFIKKKKADIVQTFHFISDTYGVAIARFSGIRYVVSSRRDMGDTKKKRQILLNKLINKLIHKFIAVCDEVAKRVVFTEGVPSEKMVTIYNGIDLENIKIESDEEVSMIKEDLSINENDFVVGTVAAFRPEKNYDIFFMAIAEVKKYIKELKVVSVGGGGSLLTHYKEYCCNNGLANTVIFTGKTGNVNKYLSIMDVACLVPGSNEGFSNAILEKMAMGKPLVVTDVGGNKESVKNGENGIVIPPRDKDKLAHAIIYLYKNASLRREMGNKGRERVEKLFSMREMIKKHEKLYEDIMCES